jgi:hypothetical protein
LEEISVIARIRRTPSTGVVLVLTAVLSPTGWLAAQDARRADAGPPEPTRPRELALSPAAAPVPALKYRLLPSAADLNPGDAAPIYLRIHGKEDAPMQPLWQQIGEKVPKWLDLPLDEFPAAEARGFANVWAGKLRQLEFGTRRKTCDWNYTLPEERSNAVDILLPDAQEMRQWGRVLALKARVEVVEKKYDEAVHTLETGIAFARHVGGGPFLINGLVGAAIANLMLTEAAELIAQPGAPNLYWALTALPRPLINLREQTETEQKMLEYMIPELSEAELARPRAPVEWAPYLARMQAGFVKWGRSFSWNGQEEPYMKSIPNWTLARLKAESLPAARDYLKASRGLDEEQLAKMCEDQVIALYVAGRYRELTDEVYKAAYLPVRDAILQLAAAEERLKAFESSPLAMAIPHLRMIQSAQTGAVWPDRQVATLRVIEAIRLYAAAHDGKLPESLDRITEVPAPEDPATGKPFIYRRAGDGAILHGPRAELRKPWTTYRITIRS